MENLCAYCGLPLQTSTIWFKGLRYHAQYGFYDGKLQYVSRKETCFEQSCMGTKSLCGRFAPIIME